MILDGNRRWAKRHLTIPKEGHWKGADSVENLLDWCEELDIKIITLYALSSENLGRNDAELEDLYELIRLRLEKLLKDSRIHRNKMRVKGIGRIELLPDSIKEVLQKLDDVTKDYDNHFPNLRFLSWNVRIALIKSIFLNSGQKISINTSSLYALCHIRNPLNLFSPDVRKIISGDD